MQEVKIGQKIYVKTQIYLSHGSDDIIGGLATVTKITEGISAGKKVPFVTVAEHPGNSYNWKFLSEEQNKLKKEFGDQIARPDPDIDRPFIEDGDTVNSKIYHGPPIW